MPPISPEDSRDATTIGAAISFFAPVDNRLDGNQVSRRTANDH